MEPIKHTLAIRLPMLRMYREDLDRLVTIFSSKCSKVTISDKKNRYESLDDLKTYIGATITELDIQGENPNVHFLLNKSERISGSPSTAVFYYNELRTEEVSDEAETLFYKIKDFLLEHRAPKFRAPYVAGAAVAAIASIVFAYIDRAIFRQGQITWNFLISLLAAVGSFIAATLGGNELRLDTRVNSPSYWRRKKEDFATTAITSLISGIVGYLIGHYLK